jgi:hypothetical protein
MLLRTSLVGFLVGVVLACAYDAFVGGCGTALGTIPLFLIGNIVEELFGTVFADHNPWLSTGITAFAHGLFLFLLSFIIILAIRKFPNKGVRVGFAMVVLLTFYAFLLFFAFPLRVCP